MRLFFVASVLFFFNFSVFAQVSPLLTIKKISLMSDDLVGFAKMLIEKEQEPSNEVLRLKVLSMYDSTFSGELLEKWKQSVDEGLAKGWALAYTDAFDWAFPPPLPEDSYLQVISSSDSQVVIECRNQILDTYVLEYHKDPLDSIFNIGGESKQSNIIYFKQEITYIYQQFQISNYPLSQYLAEADSLLDQAVYQLKSQEKFVFRLKKIGDTWKVVDMQHKFENSRLILEG